VNYQTAVLKKQRHYTPLDLRDLPGMFAAFESRWAERNERMRIIDAVYGGDLDGIDPGDEPVESRSPNLVQVAIEDTAESASTLPTIRAVPYKTTDKVLKSAAKMEQIGTNYIDRSGGKLLSIRTSYHMVAYGLAVMQILSDEDSQGAPIFEWRDPKTFYPEPGYRAGDLVRRCMFARKLYPNQIPVQWQHKIREWVESTTTRVVRENKDLTVVEYFDEYETVIAVMYQPTGPTNPTRADYIPIELERFPNLNGIVPIVAGQMIKLDNEPRGQFDQVVEPMRAHARLMGMSIDYADQSVYCLSPDAKILTNDLRYVEAGKLEVGDDLVGFDEHPGDVPSYRMWRPTKVLAADRVRLPSFRVKFADDTEFTASVFHKWLVPTFPSAHTSKWIDTAELDKNFHSSKGARVLKPLDLWEQDRSWEAGYLAGVFDGEGWLSLTSTGGPRIGIAQRDNACLHQIEQFLSHFGFEYLKMPGSGTHGDVFNLHLLGGTREVVRFLQTIRPERLIEKFISFGGASILGRFKRYQAVDVVECEFVNMTDLVALSTTTKTFIAEGYAHHNSDIWVKDPIGPIPLGGGGVIQLGPNGAIGRVPPAVSSFSLSQELNGLMESIHLGGRWPKSRPGEVDQSIASAKFLESSLGMMNTALKTLHETMQRMWEQALRIAFEIDRCRPGKKHAAGVLRNQQFIVEYSTDDIDPEIRIRAEYGLGLGRDPAQSAVLHLQYQGAGMISTEFVQESIEGLTDVPRERQRLLMQKMTDMAMAKLMMSIEQGAVTDEQLVAFAKAVRDGDDIWDIYQEQIVKPQMDAAASQITSGLDGGLVPPGMDPGAGMPGAPPGAPGPMPPPPEDPIQAIGRLAVPLGGGSFAGTQFQG